MGISRLTRCPRCGYDLLALPRRYRCPECGFAYDESMFLLEGWRLPDLYGLVRALVTWSPVALLAAGFAYVELGWRAAEFLAAAAATGAGLGALYLGGRFADQLGTPRVLRRYLITADGIARPGRHVYLWSNYSHVSLISDGEGGWRLHVYPSWWRLFGPPFVTARLEGDRAEAEAVRDEIERRMGEARGRGG